MNAQLSHNLNLTAGHAVALRAKSPVDGQDLMLAPLKAIGTISRFARNETIFSEGDPANASFKVVSGAVRLCKVLPDGRRQIADFRLAGDFFGLEATEEYALTAEALGDVVAVRYSRARLDRLEDEQADVRRDLMGVLRRDLTAAQMHLIMLGRQTAMERVASFLVQLAGRQDAESGESIEVPMGRQDIADYLGLTIETVCRAISEMKRARTIDVPDRHHIAIRNLDALQNLAEGDA
jgi:CRP/FNR family nitrogen fixation transcriptional regulator